MIEIGNSLAAKMQVLIQNGGLAAVAAALLVVFVVKRSLLALLGVGITGAVMLFGIFNPNWFKDKVATDLESSSAVIQVHTRPMPALDLSDLGVTARAAA